MRVTLAAVLVGLALVQFAHGIPAVEAQEGRAALREMVKKWQDAVVNVRVVLKVRMSMAGREMNSSDESVDTVGTVIDPSGLTVLSLSALNPGAMMNKLMSSAGGNGQDQIGLTSEPTDVKIRMSDGREVAARIVLRDEDLDLAFLRPTTAPDKPLTAVNLGEGGKPSMLDEVVVLSRLGRVGGWTPSASLHNIGAVIERPRTFYVLGGATGGDRDAGVSAERTHRRFVDDEAGRPRTGQHDVDDGRHRGAGVASRDPAGGRRAGDCRPGPTVKVGPDLGRQASDDESGAVDCDRGCELLSWWWRSPPASDRERRPCEASLSARSPSVSTVRSS